MNKWIKKLSLNHAGKFCPVEIIVLSAGMILFQLAYGGTILVASL